MWPSLQETADLVTFTEEILKGKLHFLCSVGPIHTIMMEFFTKPLTIKKGLQKV